MLHDRSKCNIQVAEDDDAIRELVVVRLGFAGYNLYQAISGPEALSKLVAIKPHGLILDVGLPQLDGFGVLKAMNDRDIKVPTLMLTARHNSEDVSTAIGLGASDYLAKPFDNGDLLRRMDRLMAAASQPRAAEKVHFI